MASNQKRSGDVLTLALPYDRAAGEAFKVGSILAVAAVTGTTGDVVAAHRVGEWAITALSTDQAAVGAKLYWDDTNKRLTVTASTHLFAGHATVAKTSGQTTATVVLCPAGA